MMELTSVLTKRDLIEESGTPRHVFGDADEAGGDLLGKDRRRVAMSLRLLYEAQDDDMQRNLAQWRVNELRRHGVTNVKLIRTGADNWSHYIPPNATPDSIPQSNKAARLCRRTEAVLFADPPAPDCVPWSGEDEDVEASIVSNRVLEAEQGPTRLDTPNKVRRAFGRASSTASGFVYYTVNPKGGGRVPIIVEASPMASSVDDATRDPMTGAPWPGEYVERYVRQDGSLTDDESEAATQWAPAIESGITTGRHVRFLPHHCDGINDADGVIIRTLVAWRKVAKLYGDKLPKGAELQQLRDTILAYEPQNADDLLLGSHRTERLNPKNPDESLCVVDTAYFTECPDYPKGAHVVVLGGRMVVVQEEWGAEVNGKWETFMLPVSQIGQFSEGDDNPYRHAMMEVLGAGNELRAAYHAHVLDWFDSLNNRKTFIPTNSIIHPGQLKARGRGYIPMNPGGEPKHEEIPDLPREVPALMEQASKEMDSDSGLEQIAQGLEDSSVQSGRHAYAILSQVHAGLSELKQNAESAYIRCCMIELQLIRAYYSTPRLLKYVGEDNEHRVKAWTGADLRNTRDVKLKAGTMTMLSPAAKADLAEKWAAMQILPPYQLKEITFKQLGGTLGVEDDPHLLRIRRQINRWNEGPPQGWQPPMVPQPGAMPDPLTGQVPMMEPVNPDGSPVMDPLTGAPVLAPELMDIFDPRPVDMTPDAAGMRFMELGRLMSSKKYSKHPPAWRAGIVAEFFRMQMALTPPAPPAEEGVPAEGAAA